MRNIFVMIFMLFLVFTTINVDASRGSQGGGGGHGSGTPHFAPVAPPPVPTNEILYDVDDVTEYIDAGDIAITDANEVLVTFHIEDVYGFVRIFSSDEEAKESHNKYLKRNKTGQEPSWSFRKRNLLMILPGQVSNLDVIKFEQIFYGIGE